MLKITNEHIILLRALCERVELDENYETVPYFNAYRPYGNSTWTNDVGELLGVDKTVLVDEDSDGTKYYDYTIEEIEHFTQLQKDLPNVLKQIVMEYRR